MLRMSVADAKAALEACQIGIDEAKALRLSNQVLVEFYNKNVKDVYTKREIYQNAKKEREIKQTEWDNNRSRIYIAKGKERQSTRNGGCVSRESWCKNDYGDGWEDDGQIDHWGCEKKRNCKKTHDTKINEANDEVGARPGNYNEPWPQDAANVVQNNTAINISCCANVFNVVGSELSDNNIIQQNECLSTKKKELAIKEDAINMEIKQEREKTVIIAIIVFIIAIMAIIGIYAIIYIFE